MTSAQTQGAGHVLKLRLMRKRAPITLPESFLRVRDLFGLDATGPFTHLELWSTGRSSYVMARAGRLSLNVSLDMQFANRAEARQWARAFAESHGLEPEPRPKCFRARTAADRAETERKTDGPNL